MSEMATVAIVALILGFLPIFALVLIIVMIGVGIALIGGFLWLLEQPAWGWVYVASFAFNAVVLLPIWTVSWLAARFEPELWMQAAQHVYIFSGALVLPTVLFYFLWQRALKQRERTDPDR